LAVNPDAGIDPDGFLAALRATGVGEWEALGELHALAPALALPRILPAMTELDYPLTIIRVCDALALASPDGANAALNAALPNVVRVRDSVRLSNRAWVRSLPDLCVHGALDLDRCVNLATLPKRLDIEFSLKLQGCASWDGKIPKKAWVAGNLFTDRHPEGIRLDEWRRLHPRGERP
jgi:hypothetical protein